MLPENRNRIQPVVLLALGVMVAGGFLIARLATGLEAGPCVVVAAGTIHESEEFTPARHGSMPERPILSRGPGIVPLPHGDGVPSRIDGRPLQFAIASHQGPYLYYIDRPIGPEMTRSEFLIAGGIAYEALSMDGGEPFAPSLFAMGDRATPVQVGDYLGALVWADPTEANVRAHGLYWADSTTNYSLVAVRGPEYLLNMGRDLVCGALG